MSNGLVGFIMAIGVAGWVYSKAMRQTGDNTKSSLIVAGFAGVFAFIAVITVLGMIL